jgi:hypothetical protein
VSTGDDEPGTRRHHKIISGNRDDLADRPIAVGLSISGRRASLRPARIATVRAREDSALSRIGRGEFQ